MNEHNIDDQLLLLDIEISFPVAPGSNGEKEEAEAWQKLLSHLRHPIWAQDITRTHTFTRYRVRRDRLQSTACITSLRTLATPCLDLQRIRKDLEVYVSVVTPQVDIKLLNHNYLRLSK